MKRGPMSSDVGLRERNRRFYDSMWSGAQLVEPERFNTWPLVCSLVAQLRQRAASVALDSITSLPFADGTFDLVCAFDIVEHVDEDDLALSELARVSAPAAVLLLSVPLHPAFWTPFDDFVGHCRRYEPQRLLAKLAEHGFKVESSAVYGMQPQSSWLLDLRMWALVHKREQAMWWYNHVMMPFGLRFQKALALSPGMIDTEQVDEVLLVCRKQGTLH